MPASSCQKPVYANQRATPIATIPAPSSQPSCLIQLRRMHTSTVVGMAK